MLAAQVEDIVDTGHTLKSLVSNLQQQGAASVKVVTLLNKQARRVIDIQADYIGFEVSIDGCVARAVGYVAADLIPCCVSLQLMTTSSFQPRLHVNIQLQGFCCSNALGSMCLLHLVDAMWLNAVSR